MFPFNFLNYVQSTLSRQLNSFMQMFAAYLDENDDDAKAFVELARDAGVPAPAEDNIGYEVEGDDGEVIATVEIAWPDKHVGFMIADQAEDKEKLENMG